MSELVLSLFPGIGLLDRAFEEEGFCVVRGPDVLWGGDVCRFRPPAGKFDGVIGGPPCQAFSQLSHLVRAGGKEPKFGNLIPEFERCVLEAAPAWFLMENVRAAPVPFGDFGGGPNPERNRYGINAFLLDNSALDGGDGHGLEQRRVRRITFGMRRRSAREVGPAPCLMNWIDLATFLLPDAERTTTQYPVDNSPEAKQRVPAGNGGHSDPNESLTAARRTPGAEFIGSGRTTDPNRTSRVSRFLDALRLQGLPEDFLADAPFTAEGKLKAVANGVPLTMGRALARAVREAIAQIG